MRLLALLLIVLPAAGAFRYNGYRVLKVGPLNNLHEAKLVAELADNDERIKQVILLNEYVTVSSPIHLAVAPESFSRVSTFLDKHEFVFSVVNDDLQRSFDETMRKNEVEAARWRSSGSKAAPTNYLTYTEQVDWMTSTAAASAQANTFTIGQSYEGRDMVGVMINDDDTTLPAIWIDANQHAAEWITSATALYLIDKILFGTSNDASALRTNFRWYILPNANPDGYNYTWTTDRLWQKTRSSNANSSCIGVDLTLNWDVNWGGPGSGSDPCGGDYGGAAPFSEPETQHMSSYMNTIKDITNVMLTLHSYGQFWLCPWGAYTYKPPDYNELLRVGNLAADAIQNVNGLVFQVGTQEDLIHQHSGGGMDWAKSALNIAYSYQPELRPETADDGGYVIPPENIASSGAEIFDGLVEVARNAQHKLPIP